MSRSEWADLLSKIIVDGLVTHNVGKGVSFVKNAKLPASILENELLLKINASLEQSLARQVEMVTTEGIAFKASQAAQETNVLKNAAEKSVSGGFSVVNQSSEAILKNGYYEVNGFKFSEFYYNRLWVKGRPAPSLLATEILQEAKNIASDLKKIGFFRYEHGNWEMVYNPVTKEVWHLSPINQR